MTFAQPRMFWLMAVALPLLCLFLVWAWRKKQRLTAEFVRSRLLAELTMGVSRTAQKLKMVFLVLAVALLLLALARPQMGYAWEEAQQRGLDLMIALDTSRSMLAEDLPPNRLTRAKLAALDLMRLAKTDRLGLIAFAGSAFLQCPLTLDDDAFQESLAAVEVGVIPQGGTALGQAIDSAVEALKNQGDNYKVLVLFSDGEDHDQGALQAAEKAAQAGIRIFTVGVGTTNGELLRARDETGQLGYVKDSEGNVVKSRLNDDLLQEVATAAQGFYLQLSGVNPMEALYEKGLAPLPRSDLASKWTRQYKEWYQWPLGLAILLLLFELLLSERKRVPPRRRPAGTVPRPLQKALPLLLSVVCLLPTHALGSAAGALRSYESGSYDAALQEFERLLVRRPDDVRLHYNAGTAAYQAGRYEDANRHFSTALTAPDLSLQQRSYYNLGNTWFRTGEKQQDPAQTIPAWEQALKHYEGALKLNPQDPDAQFNRDLVKKRLEELKRQQQEQQQKDQNQQKQDSSSESEEKKDKQQDQGEQEQDQQNEQKPPDEQKSQEEQRQNGEQPQEEQKPGDAQPSDQEKPESPDEQKEEESGKQPQPSPGEQPNASQTNSAANPSMLGRMTPEQAKRLLDTEKNEQKAMIFAPKDKKQARSFKDW